MNLRRRTVLAALVAGGVGGAALSPASSYLDRFAPLSGDLWSAARTRPSGPVDSPDGAATVSYDDLGVPTVRADDEAALYFAVGYVQAADRLFQMDLFRRRMAGELSAVVGGATLESDRFHRRMDVPAAAEANWRAVRETPTADALRAYSRGVNAYIEREPTPAEFALLEYEPQPWTPTATMLVEKAIGWGLTGSFETLRRATVADALGPDAADRLHPRRLDHDVPILRPTVEWGEGGDAGGSAAADEAPLDASALLDWLGPHEADPGVGSNSWVVSGEHTASGQPLLANDPHLSLMAPPVWYEMHHEFGDRWVGGVTFPGVPFVVIGRNDAGAWGFTNAGVDGIDFYRYDTDGDRYRYRGEWRAFETETQTIPVADAADEEVTVRKTVHGPMLEREGQRVAVAWTGLMGSRTACAVHQLNRSDGLDDALDALAKFDQPTQNAVYADRDGNTHYHVTGLVPTRRTDGQPARGDRVHDGSAGEGEWPGYEPYGLPDREAGFLDFEEKPHAVQPDLLGTANQRIVDDGVLEEYLAESYSAPWRGARIYELLDRRAQGEDPIDHAYSRRVQRDVLDRRAVLFVPEVLAARDAMDARAREAADHLATWDYRMTRDSRAALVFARFLAHYGDAVFGPVLEAAGLDASYGGDDWVLLHLDAADPWFTDPPAGEPRDRSQVIADAMADAAAEIDDAGWETYGDYNRTAIDHPFDQDFLNYPRYPTDGSPATVRNFRHESAVGSSYRLLARFDGEPGERMVPGGNSGRPFDDHYADQLRRWADGEYTELGPASEGDPDVRFEPEGDR